MNQKTIQLVPYLHFNGDCEEALTTYQKILGGEINVVNRYDNPAMNAPEEYKNKILHASYSFGGNTILASDTMPGKSLTRGTGDVSLSISVSSPEEGQKIFDQLLEGGKLHFPFKRQFWGAWHGNFTDRFGIHWMVNAD
jgi:PhnB protein